ncbi:MAG: ISL3 family transposase [Nocardioidaceae bacterium]
MSTVRRERRGDGVRKSKLCKKLLGVEHLVVEDGDIGVGPDGREMLVIRVRPDHRHRNRCSRCGRRCRYRDGGEGRRRWRGLDVGVMRCFVEAEAPRVTCPAHGVVVAAVPWARANSRFTTAFEEQAAWACAAMAGTRAAQLLGTTWRSLQSIVERVVADLAGTCDRLDGLRRIGIDELSYRKGHRYIMVVVDHDTGRLVWAADGRCQDTVHAFFDVLGPERTAQLAEVSADGAEWLHDVVAERAPQARICLDSYHVVAWANEALAKVRRRLAVQLRGIAELKDTRWAVIKDPANLTSRQRTTIAILGKLNSPLYRAYMIKEQLRDTFATGGDRGKTLLAGLVAWCARCRIPEFVALGRTLRRFRDLIGNTLDTGTTNGRVEATNTHLRALTKRAYGFHSPQALIAMATLTRGGLCQALPRR